MENKPRRWTRWLRRLLLYPLGVLVLAGIGLFAFVMATRYHQQDPPEAPQALTGATVLLGADLEPHDDVTVLVSDGVITQAGPADEVPIPADAEVVDLQGHTLLPGLIDMHVHLGTPENLGTPETEGDYGWQITGRAIIDAVRHYPNQRQAMLQHGVTTMRSLGDDGTMVLEVQQMVEDGTLEGPRVFAAGPLFTTPGGHPVQTFHGGEVLEGMVLVPGSPQEARQSVTDLADSGVDLIKVVHERGVDQQPLEPIATDVLAAIVDEAGAHDLPVVAHWGTQADLDELLGAGVDGLEHFQLRGELAEGWGPEHLQQLTDDGVYVGPTLAVTDAAGQGWSDEAWPLLQDRFGEMHEAGVPVLASSDAPLNGLGFGSGLHRELELLVEFGLTPTEALRAATSTAAHALGTEDIGVIETGRAADLLAVQGDPLADITAVQDVAAVWRDGRPVVEAGE